MDATHLGYPAFDWTYPIAFIWGLLVVTSLVGWGLTIGGWLLPGREDDYGWGLAAAWGMAGFLILSGPLLMLSAFSKTFVVIYLFAGLVLILRHLSMRQIKDWRAVPPTIGLKFFLIVLGGLILFTYTAAVSAREYDQYDDLAAYFYLTRKALDMGTYFDPFNYRMLGALGGQITLSNFVFDFLPWKYANLLDHGIAGLIVLGLTQEFVRGDGPRAWTARLILLALFLTFPVPHTNTGSENTGVVLFAAMFRTLDLILTHRLWGWRSAFLLCGCAVAAATLRCHNVFAVALLGMGFGAFRLWQGSQKRHLIVRELLLITICTLLLIAPWWFVSYRSGNTFLYPLLKGNHQPQFRIFEQDTTLMDNIRFALGFFYTNSFLLLFVPVCLLKSGAQKQAYLISGVVILFISFVFLLQFNMGTIMYPHAYRYLIPLALAYGLFTSGLLAQQLVETPPEERDRWFSMQGKFATALVVLLLFLQAIPFAVQQRLNEVSIQWSVDRSHEIWGEGVGPIQEGDVRQEYSKAFACIPKEAKTLIALDYPFFVDNRAHNIVSIDEPGAASPAPGMPYFRGTAAVREYLRAQGIRYIANVPFERSQLLYSRTTANRELGLPGPFFHLVGSYSLNFFDNIDALAKESHLLYESSAIRVIDLGE